MKYNKKRLKHLCNTTLQSIQMIKKAGLLFVALQILALSIQAFDSNDDTQSVFPSISSPATVGLTAAEDSNAENSTVLKRTTSMTLGSHIVLNMSNELLLKITNFMDFETLRSFQICVNILERRYHQENNHRDQQGNLEKNILLQDAAIIACILQFNAHIQIKKEFPNPQTIITSLENGLDTDFPTYFRLLESFLSHKNKQMIMRLYVRPLCLTLTQSISLDLADQDPFFQFVIIAHAHQLFSDNMNNYDRGEVVKALVGQTPQSIQQLIKSAEAIFSKPLNEGNTVSAINFLISCPPEMMQLIGTHADNLFRNDASFNHRSFVITTLADVKPEVIEFIAMHVAHTPILTNNRDNWDVIMDLACCDLNFLKVIIRHVHQLFPKEMPNLWTRSRISDLSGHSPELIEAIAIYADKISPGSLGDWEGNRIIEFLVDYSPAQIAEAAEKFNFKPELGFHVNLDRFKDRMKQVLLS